MADASATTTSPLLRAAGSALTRALGRPTRANRFDTAALVLEEGVLRLSFAEQGRLTVIEVEADVTGTCRVALAPRLLANIASTLARGSVILRVRRDEIEIGSGRSSFAIWCRTEDSEDTPIPTDGLRFDRDEELLALRRIVTATAGARRNDDDVRILLQHANGSLRLEFDTFDIAASDDVRGISGSIPAGPVATPAGEFSTALSLFDDGFPRLTVSPSPHGDALWLTGRHRRHPMVIAARVPIWRLATRDPARIAAGPRPHSVTFRARSMRSALRRCVIASEGWGDGPYIWMRVNGGQRRIRVMMHGWSAASSEWVSCEYSGPEVELALPYYHLSSAIRYIDGDVVLSFGDPSKPVMIKHGDAYRCVLRPLPPAPPDSPAHRTFFQNVPFPR